MLIRLFGNFQDTFVLEVRSSVGAVQTSTGCSLLAVHRQSCSHCVHFYMCLGSAVTVLVHQSPCFLDRGDTAALSTNQIDNDIFRPFFAHCFVIACCRPLAFTDSGCFIMRQHRCQYTPVGWKKRNVGGEGKRVMSLQQILQEATAAVMYFQLGRTGSLQRELHSF